LGVFQIIWAISEKIKKLQAERGNIIHRMEEERAAAAAAAAASGGSHSKYKCPKDFQEKVP
jgi:hypothetical protein